MIVKSNFVTENLGKGPNGRTQTKTTITFGDTVKVVYGELLDSEEDYKIMKEFNEDMEKVRQDFNYKNAMSEQSAKKVWINC